MKHKAQWEVQLSDEFAEEFKEFSTQVQDETYSLIRLLQHFGPQLGRPRVDTLKGSKHANMKELRFDADGGVWRLAFAFDSTRSAILLVGADKSGGSEKRFYRELIRKADRRFDAHLKSIEKRNYGYKRE
jgi:hypothetical protein